MKKFILLMPYKNKASANWFAPAGAITWARDWEEVISILKADHPNGAKVAVIPDATIQFFDKGAVAGYVGKSAALAEKTRTYEHSQP
jgi:hypothetical protein